MLSFVASPENVTSTKSRTNPCAYSYTCAGVDESRQVWDGSVAVRQVSVATGSWAEFP